MFIIANLADGYGVDNCLATRRGVRQGGGQFVLPLARLRAGDCRSARSTASDITGAIPASASSSCNGGSCDNFVAIECSR